MLASLPKVSKT